MNDRDTYSLYVVDLTGHAPRSADQMIPQSPSFRESSSARLARESLMVLIDVSDYVVDGAEVDDACGTVRASIHDVRISGKGVSTR
jgi:hypothetical protein